MAEVEYRVLHVLAPWETEMARFEWNTGRQVGRLYYTVGSLRGTVLELSEPAARATITAFAHEHHCHFMLEERVGMDWPDAPNFNTYRATRQGVI